MMQRNGLAGVGASLWCVGLQNEGLQQTRSALPLTAAALAAEPRCSAGFSDRGAGLKRRLGPTNGVAPLTGVAGAGDGIVQRPRPREATALLTKPSGTVQRRRPVGASGSPHQAGRRGQNGNGVAVLVAVSRRPGLREAPPPSWVPRGCCPSQRRLSPAENRPRQQAEGAGGIMMQRDGLAGVGASLWSVGLQNEALQQTKPAFTTHGAVFAAERRCSADSWRPDA